MPSAEGLSQSRRLGWDMIKVHTIVKRVDKQNMELFFTKSPNLPNLPEFTKTGKGKWIPKEK